MVALTGPDFDKERFEALVLYIAHRRKDDVRFGRTKVAKVLFYSDFAVYQNTGEALTGATYIRMPFGPFPTQLGGAESDLKANGLVQLDYATAEYEEKRIIPIQDEYPTQLLSQFEDWQLETVKLWTDRIGSASARYISDLSHKHPGWIMAEDRAEIPYEQSVLPYEKPTPAENEQAKELARERGWLTADGEWLWERELT